MRFFVFIVTTTKYTSAFHSLHLLHVNASVHAIRYPIQMHIHSNKSWFISFKVLLHFSFIFFFTLKYFTVKRRLQQILKKFYQTSREVILSTVYINSYFFGMRILSSENILFLNNLTKIIESLLKSTRWVTVRIPN